MLVERGSSTTRYLHLPTGVATDDGAWTYSVPDGLGSVRQRLDASGQVAAVNDYRPFGSPLDGGGGDPYGYTGEWWEGDAGLLFLRARYYDPATGRFVSRDPFVGYLYFPQTQNRYVYVINRPTLFIDPSGLDWQNPTGPEGVAIHTMIQVEYVAEAAATGRRADREVLIPFAKKQNDVTLLLWLATNFCLRLPRDPDSILPDGRADILDYTLREVYEIKHMPSWVVGQADAIWYATALNSLPEETRQVLFFGPPNWRPGTTYSEIPRYIGQWPTDPEAQVWAKRAGHGVIGYWGVKKEKKQQREPVPVPEPVPIFDHDPLPNTEDSKRLQPAGSPAPSLAETARDTALIGIFAYGLWKVGKAGIGFLIAGPPGAAIGAALP